MPGKLCRDIMTVLGISSEKHSDPEYMEDAIIRLYRIMDQGSVEEGFKVVEAVKRTGERGKEIGRGPN